MQINIDTPVIKDSSELKSPYISVYNQVFVQNETAKLIIHHEIYPIYIGDSKRNIIPNESVLYFIKNNKTDTITCYQSFYQALCEFYKLK
jgi:hypothetical protein